MYLKPANDGKHATYCAERVVIGGVLDDSEIVEKGGELRLPGYFQHWLAYFRFPSSAPNLIIFKATKVTENEVDEIKESQSVVFLVTNTQNR